MKFYGYNLTMEFIFCSNLRNLRVAPTAAEIQTWRLFTCPSLLGLNSGRFVLIRIPSQPQIPHPNEYVPRLSYISY